MKRVEIMNRAVHRPYTLHRQPTASQAIIYSDTHYTSGTQAIHIWYTSGTQAIHRRYTASTQAIYSQYTGDTIVGTCARFQRFVRRSTWCFRSALKCACIRLRYLLRSRAQTLQNSNSTARRVAHTHARVLEPGTGR